MTSPFAAFETEFLHLRGLQVHVRKWGNPQAPKIFMIHGWMDVSASFQFVVDALKNDWYVIAPDLRGFGHSKIVGAYQQASFWFPDYLADVEAVFDHYAPNEAIHLLGHSLGGNIVMIYAGVRPQRIKKLVNLEGFGMPFAYAKEAPQRFANWLDALKADNSLRTYANLAEVQARLQKTNPRLSQERAAFLAQYWSRKNEHGCYEILAESGHKIPSPTVYHVDDVLACWRNIAAPVLWVEAEETELWKMLGHEDELRQEIDRRIQHIPHQERHIIREAGHMLHHDQPEVLAALIEKFLLA